MRIAITTKFIGPTNSRGSRVKATAIGRGSVTLNWDHAVGVDRNHAMAAQALAEKMNWKGRWIGGGLDDRGYVFVVDDADPLGSFECFK